MKGGNKEEKRKGKEGRKEGRERRRGREENVEISGTPRDL